MGHNDEVQRLIETHLPPYDRAHYLAQVYIEQIFWLFRGVQREQILEDMLPVVYARINPQSYPGHGEAAGLALDDYGGPHDLSLLFMVFAIASLVDPRSENKFDDGEDSSFVTPTAAAQAEHYHQIAW